MKVKLCHPSPAYISLFYLNHTEWGFCPLQLKESCVITHIPVKGKHITRPTRRIMVYERMPVWLKHGEQVESDDCACEFRGSKELEHKLENVVRFNVGLRDWTCPKQRHLTSSSRCLFWPSQRPSFSSTPVLCVLLERQKQRPRVSCD